MARRSQRISSPALAQRSAIRGRYFGATVEWTSSVSRALQTDGLCTFAL